MGKVHVGDKLLSLSFLTGGGEGEWMDGRMRGVTKVSRQIREKDGSAYECDSHASERLLANVLLAWLRHNE